MHLRLLYKKFLCVFMSLMIVIFSTQSAYATTSVGGWTALDTVTAGATNTINAAKTAGGKALNSAVTVAPSAAKVGKHLIKGGGAAALAFAMVELADGAINWVLDPANNRVIVNNPPADTDTPQSSPYLYSLEGPTAADVSYSPSGVCASRLASGNYPSWAGSNYRYDASKGAYGACVADVYPNGWPVNRYSNPAYNPDAVPPNEEEYIPIETVAAKVISNAATGHAPSQEAVKATALEGFAAGEHDAALDAAATEAGTENPPDTDNPPVTDPAVPFDPSSIIAAINSLKALLAGILSSITDFSDWWKSQWTTFATAITDFNTWVRAEPAASTLEPEPVDVSDGAIIDGFEDKVNAGYVNMGNTQCPADVLIPISYMGASTNLSLSYVPFCHFASIIRYAVILGAWVAALMIISGGRTKE